MRKGSECTRISPEVATSAGNPMFSRQASRSDHGRTAHSGRDRPRQARGGCRLLRSARWTAARFCWRARVTVVTAFWPAPNKKGSPGSTAASRSPECTPARNSSRRQSSVVVADDSHKSEAVEECIRFMNSSSRKYR
uniref:Uncharacterized protein n=1 Tax=Avena sativa TaxID=4498 RepID=A0ACD5VX01_AVESA